MVALCAAVVTVAVLHRGRLPALRETVDAGANASALPMVSVASLVGFGAVVAALPAFPLVRDWVLSIEGGPLVSLTVATNVPAAGCPHRFGVGRVEDRPRGPRRHLPAKGDRSGHRSRR